MSTADDIKQLLEVFHENSKDGFFYGHANELIDALYNMHDMTRHPLPDVSEETVER